jgi:hypothetical protein
MRQILSRIIISFFSLFFAKKDGAFDDDTINVGFTTMF